jgi:predicted RNA-binding protein with PUA-like domain
MARARHYWLMKSEPSVFSVQDLAKKPHRTAPWDGVRNYQARNHMMGMKAGDGVLFYHSSEPPVGVAGIAEVAREAYPDHTARDRKSEYYDPKATGDKPRWFMVDVRWVASFPELVTLDSMRRNRRLRDMLLLRKGNRLSVIPVTAAQFAAVEAMAKPRARATGKA